MNSQQEHPPTSSDELPDLEILGEWDHGILDPVLVLEGKANPRLVSYQGLKRTFRKVEDGMEHMVRNTFHKVEHAVEEMIHRGDQVQAFDDELAGVVDVGHAVIPMDNERKH